MDILFSLFGAWCSVFGKIFSRKPKTKNRKPRLAQSTLEYAMVIAVLVAALVAMGVYAKRGMEGRLRSAADQLGPQYSPGNTISTNLTMGLTSKSYSDTTVTEDPNDNTKILSTTDTASYSAQTQSGTETVGALEEKVF